MERRRKKDGIIRKTEFSCFGSTVFAMNCDVWEGIIGDLFRKDSRFQISFLYSDRPPALAPI